MTTRKKGLGAVLMAVAGVVCGLAVVVRDNTMGGAVHDGAEKVCELCEANGILPPDAGVAKPTPPAPPDAEPPTQEPSEPPAPGGAEPAAMRGEVRLGVTRAGTGWKPVLLPGMSAAPRASATVEELPEEPPASSQPGPVLAAPPRAGGPHGPGAHAPSARGTAGGAASATGTRR
ncbi:hypothetical protein [Stigmatella erecta]|uniref:Uncharacterized protein n=1 Tax=Stigmatella erecta TaxID=83460 RepID=A0A1I0LAC5_9BACT|nr:hypothetical protein [Stigmatella erecta]SEU36975.1 hypothetical protein SAMN05443639_12326 [Stigmatella erecta]